MFLLATLRWSNTSNKLLQLATQHCCVPSWKTLLHVLPPTSNIVTQQNFVVASRTERHVAASWTGVYCFQHFVAWQCLRWVVIRATTLFNLQLNKCEEKCCPYYRVIQMLGRWKKRKNKKRYNFKISIRNLFCDFKTLYSTCKSIVGHCVEVNVRQQLS